MTPLLPPRLAERVLSLLVPDSEWRDSIVGDLREEFAELSTCQGRRMARRWYWRQALAIGGRTLASRLGASRLPRGSWLAAAADVEPRGVWHAGLIRDCRQAWRALLRRPGTSSIVVSTLALTLAVNATLFALTDALVLRPFRFRGIDRVVVIMSDSPQDPMPDAESVAAADFREWRVEARTLKHLSAAEWWDANLSGIETPEQIAGYRVTADFFEALGAVPMLGRTFPLEEETPGQHRRRRF